VAGIKAEHIHLCQVADNAVWFTYGRWHSVALQCVCLCRVRCMSLARSCRSVVSQSHTDVVITV